MTETEIKEAVQWLNENIRGWKGAVASHAKRDPESVRTFAEGTNKSKKIAKSVMQMYHRFRIGNSGDIYERVQKLEEEAKKTQDDVAWLVAVVKQNKVQ